MRRLLIGDVLVLAHHLKPVPKTERIEMGCVLIQEAHCADKWRKKTARLHPLWGDGSLMARVLIGAGPNPAGFDLGQDDDILCLQAALSAIEKWRHRKF